MSVLKNHISVIMTVCILVIILVLVLYFSFFFNKTTIQCDTREKFAELIGRNFSDVEITDIQYKYVKDEAIGVIRTQIFIFLKESNELESKEYYVNSNGEGVFDPNLEHIPPGNITELKEMGIDFSQIQNHGLNYNQIRVGFSTAPFEIHWYQIDESYDGKSNVVLNTSIPRKILINVDEIIQGQWQQGVGE